MKTINNISLFLVLAAAAFFSPATQAIDPPLGQASYSYDANNRLTKVVYSNARTVSFTYDNNGNLVSMATDGGTKGIALDNGTALTGIAGSKDSNKLYTFAVPAGQSLLEIKVSGGTGDCDLEVSNSAGGVNRYSLNSGNSETIRISEPPEGTWMVNLIYKRDVSGLSLVAITYSGAPLAPAGLKATDGTFPDKIVLTWTEAAGASSYSVYRNDTGTTSTGANLIAEVEDTTYTDTDATLVNTKNYTYFVRSKRSATASTLFSAGDAGHISRIPVAPKTTAASDGTYFDKIRVTWTSVPGASSYDVERYADMGLTTKEKTFTDITGLSYDDGTCVLDKTYYYAVTAKINNVPGVRSNGDAGFLSKNGPATIKATSGTLYNIIRLTWAPVPGATSYGIYWDGSLSENASTTSTTYDFIRAPAFLLDHSFMVKAKYAVNESNFSPVANGKFGNAPAIPAAPVLKGVSTDLYKFIRLTWGEVATAEQYNIYRSEGTVFNLANKIATVNVPTLSHDNKASDLLFPVTADTKYNYWVTAYNSHCSTTQESNPSAMMSGRAATSTCPALTGGTPVTPISGTIKEKRYYSILVPTGTTRLVATLTNTTNTNDCDLYLKLGCYPTTTSYNVKGTESGSSETAIVANPTDNSTWYIMLNAFTSYSGVTLRVDCYSAANIILTQIPLNDQIVTFVANFKGRVVDEVGTGISGLNIKVRDPIKGITTTLTTKTDAKGYFSYGTTVNLEGEHTYDFFFDKFPETGLVSKETASHTISTRIGVSGLFDSSSYLPATPVPFAGTGETIGMQTFLNIRNGWDPAGTIDSAYEDLWVDSTIIKTNNDSAIADKCIDGLFIVFYGVEGAGAGNDTTATSALSAVPLVLHVTPGANLTTVLNNLGTGLGNLGVISDSQKADILAGKLGLLSIAVLKDPDEIVGAPSDLSLLANDELSLISALASNTNTTKVGTADYSGGVTTTIFTIDLYGDGKRKINIVTVAY